MKNMKNIGITDQEIEILLAQWEAAKKDIENKFVIKEEDGKLERDLEKYFRI